MRTARTIGGRRVGKSLSVETANHGLMAQTTEEANANLNRCNAVIHRTKAFRTQFGPLNRTMSENGSRALIY